VSSVDLLVFLKKSLGIVIKRLEEEGVLALPTFTDHRFVPVLEVGDAQVEVPVRGMLYKVKVIGDAPVYVNFDRPVDGEYTVVYPGSYIVVPRLASRVYLKAPTGYTSRVVLEVLA